MAPIYTNFECAARAEKTRFFYQNFPKIAKKYQKKFQKFFENATPPLEKIPDPPVSGLGKFRGVRKSKKKIRNVFTFWARRVFILRAGADLGISRGRDIF